MDSKGNNSHPWYASIFSYLPILTQVKKSQWYVTLSTRIFRGLIKGCLGLSWLTFLAIVLLRVDFGGQDDELEVVRQVSRRGH